ncbi:unnamed protein product [Cyprideis torosa]|uniref:URB1 C-terminal domain-containing protein n=1 Tax=Cyprideis torosa TaxID=163714 RepID=A0A7R8W7E9_9CRUS|nr:unnamed protein product [Cyprideis torosa]CAG0887505.1 unnamed protein product [Cyprideis torosa]
MSILLHRLDQASSLDLSPFQPFVFGPRSVEHYATLTQGVVAGQNANRQSSSKLSPHETVVALLDRKKVLKTAVEGDLAVDCDLEDVESCLVPVSPAFYDPRFLTPLLSSYMSQDKPRLSLRPLMNSNLLSVPLSLLASRHKSSRLTAFALLIHFRRTIAETSLKDRDLWTKFVDVLAASVGDLSERIPRVVACFLALSASVLADPTHFMHRPIAKFLFLKPELDLRNIPEFYRLFDSPDLNHFQQRSWILFVLKVGLRDATDYQCLLRRDLLKLLLVFFCSPAAKESEKIVILKILENLTLDSTVGQNLLHERGLLSWLIELIPVPGNAKMSSVNQLRSILSVGGNLWRMVFHEEEPEKRKKKPLALNFLLDFDLFCRRICATQDSLLTAEVFLDVLRLLAQVRRALRDRLPQWATVELDSVEQEQLLRRTCTFVFAASARHQSVVQELLDLVNGDFKGLPLERQRALRDLKDVIDSDDSLGRR